MDMTPIFNPHASSYDQWYYTPVGRIYNAQQIRALRRLVPDHPIANRLLDVGCGTGFRSAWFAHRGFEVTGLDASPEMLEQAMKKQIPHTHFLEGTAEAIPFEDASFNWVVSLTMLEFVENPRICLDEMLRVLRTDGFLLVGVLNKENRINKKRLQKRKPPFDHATFYTQKEVLEFFKPYGYPQIETVSYHIPLRLFYPLSSVFESIFRWLHIPKGALHLALIQKS